MLSKLLKQVEYMEQVMRIPTDSFDTFLVNKIGQNVLIETGNGSNFYGIIVSCGKVETYTSYENSISATAKYFVVGADNVMHFINPNDIERFAVLN
jgi:small nuclear ribonucleoprotein (snRNP)-like protein